ncbi:Vegetative incompatibility protein [Paramyrothecium foliicola]|nr:Vegetative incompatibility protein [Paramyrothecium foliicola]
MRQSTDGTRDLLRMSGENLQSMDASPGNMFGRAIDEFLADLAEKEKSETKNPFIKELLVSQKDALVAKDVLSQADVQGNELQKFMVDLESRKHSGRTYRILDRLGPFLEGLKNMLRMCESLAQASPLGVGAAFAGARVVLELAITHHTYFDIIVGAMERIGDCLACYEKFEEAFNSSSEFQDRLTRSYKRIIEFWYSISRHLSQKHLFLKSLTTALISDTQDALDGLKDDCQHIQGLANATGSLELKREREKNIQQGVRDWIMGGIPYVDTREDQRRELGRRQDDTCTWLFQDKRFIDWRDNTRQNSVLWYNADPGAGKTVMTSAIIDHLIKEEQPVAWWYFSFNNPKRRHAISCLRSLALRLLTILEYVPDELLAVCEEEMKHHAVHLDSISVAIEAVHKLINQCSHIHIVIDGIDECFDEDDLLRNLPLLIRKDTRGLVKWLFTSRNHANIRNMMNAVQAVEIVPDQEALFRDVQLYFTENLKVKRNVSKYTERESNFLYAKFVCDTLHGEGFTCNAEIEEALEKFPKNLTNYYTRALEKITLQTEEKQEFARRVFSLVVGALQPITLDEAIDALAVRQGAEDYDPDLRPRQVEMINELCAPLLTFDGSEETNKNPVLKLYHKTVEDFFLQDPDELRVGNHLRKFFKTRRDINVELGLQCLTYLSYHRYTKSLNLEEIVHNPPKEHAFLRYAATFWFQHLLSEPSAEVVAATRHFLKSKALWNCLEVQGRVSPFLFGRYASQRRRGAYRMGIRGAGCGDDDCFGVPLPQWLDKLSAELRLLDRSFCCFLDEWREVLVVSPQGLPACLPLTKTEGGCHLSPLSKARPLKVEYLADKLDLGTISEIAQIKILLGKPLWARVLCRTKTGRHDEFQRLQVPLFSKQKPTQASLFLPIDRTNEDETVEFVENIDGEEVSLEAWSVDQETLTLRHTTRSVGEQVKLPLSMHREVSLRREERQKLFLEPVVCSAINTPVQMFRLIWRRDHSKFPMAASTEDDVESSSNESDAGLSSDDDDAESVDDDEHEAGSEHDSSNDDESDDDDDDDDGHSTSSTSSQDGTAERVSDSHSITSVEESSDEGLFSDTLIVVGFGRRPQWLNGWRSPSNKWAHISAAAHPYLPKVAVTHTPFKLEILDLETGKQQTKTLPELADLQAVPVASTRQLRFSPCGHYLHFLLISFVGDGPGTRCHVKLSTFDFNDEGDADDTLVRGFQARSCTYWAWERPENIAPPLALTFWNDDAVVVALPPLTCDPRILKIPLPRGTDANRTTSELEGDDDAAILTLREQIYFPSTTTRRSSELIYRAGGVGEDDYLFLSLGPLLMTPTSDLTDISRAKPPVVLRWKIAGKDGWQPCDANMVQGSLLSGETSMIRRLRGTFVDENRSFGVPIRGGLNWSRKGFLSCG